MKGLMRDFSLSAAVAGFIATVISYAGPLVIIFQAADAAHLSRELLSSWVWAISIGSALLGIGLSLRYRVPIIIAWSAPGSALLVALLPGISMNEAVGAYLLSSLIIFLVGISGAFDRVISKLPGAIAAAMLAGILLRFGTGLFVSLQGQPGLVLAMFVTYLVCKRLLPRYAVMAVLVVGCAIAILTGQLHREALVIGLATPVWVTPQFSLSATFERRLATGDGGTDRAVRAGHGRVARLGLRHAGQPDHRLQRAGHGAVGAVWLPWPQPGGDHCRHLHRPRGPRRPGQRYVAGVVGGLCYLVLGIFGATLVSLFAAFPKELIAALAGLALFAAIAGALANAMAVPHDREAALVTFLTTASGMSLFGLSAAFWG